MPYIKQSIILKFLPFVATLLFLSTPVKAYTNLVSLFIDSRNEIDLTYERRIGNLGLEVHPGIFNYLTSNIKNNIDTSNLVEYRPSIGVAYFIPWTQEFELKNEADVGYSFNGNSYQYYGSGPVPISQYQSFIGNYLFETLRISIQMNINRISLGIFGGGAMFQNNPKGRGYDDGEWGATFVQFYLGGYSGIDF